MMLVEAVTARLQGLVPTDLRKVEGAADMMALMKANALPQQTPAAHVVPVGLRGGARQDVAGAFVQDIEETIGVTITMRGNDPAGSRALSRVGGVIAAVIAALVGWGPDNEPGEFRLVRGVVLRIDAEALVYLIEFAIPLQLRFA